jgi:putative hydrolase of the HAD superfamily
VVQSSGMTRRYEYVFLDAGETLFQTTSPTDGFARVLARVGYQLAPERIAKAVERARRQAMEADHIDPGPDYAIASERAVARRRRLLDAIVRAVGVRDEDSETCRSAIWESWVGTEFFNLYPDVASALAALKAAGYRLAVISNWEPRLELLCRNHGLADHFEFVLASEAEGYAKPGPHLFRRALELAAIEPGKAVHVGDSHEHDVLGATAAGIDAILLDRGRYYPPGQWNPTIRSLDELPRLLSGTD